jgi:hypothetical protein
VVATLVQVTVSAAIFSRKDALDRGVVTAPLRHSWTVGSTSRRVASLHALDFHRTAATAS